LLLYALGVLALDATVFRRRDIAPG
jgi:hypothetical protein